MDSVSFQRFEAARLLAQAKLQETQAARSSAQNFASSGATSSSAAGSEIASLIEAKKREMNADLVGSSASSISGISRNTEVEEAPISGMFKNLGRIANQYLASQVSERELSSTPHQKILGNYVDVSV